MNDNFDKLAAQFADSVVAQNAAIERHDPTVGNEFAKKYIEASEALIGGGPDGIAAFAHLLDDERVAVRVMAASYLLPYRTSDALPILQQAAQGKGITALGALMALKRWKERDEKK